MRASHEIVVSRADFLTATARTLGARSRRRLADDETLLYQWGDRLAIATAVATAEIDAVGRWDTPVAVNAVVLRRLADKLPQTETLVLVFAADRLFVGPTGVPARPAAVVIGEGQEGRKAFAVRVVVRSGARPKAVGRPHSRPLGETC